MTTRGTFVLARIVFTLATATTLLASGCGQVGEDKAISTVYGEALGAGYWDNAYVLGSCSNVQLCNDMHCCPTGHAMVGAHFGGKSFYCRPYLGNAEQGCYVDSTTVRNGMRACPWGYYMKGYSQGQNISTCCLMTHPPVEYLDGPGLQQFNQLGGAVVSSQCPPATANGHVCADGYAMSGVNKGSNVFTCTSS